MTDTSAQPTALATIQAEDQQLASQPYRAMEKLKTPQQKALAFQLAGGLRTASLDAILKFGEEPQSRLNQATRPVLERVKAKDAGEAGKVLSELIGKMKGFDPKVLQRRTSAITNFIRGNPLVQLRNQYRSVDEHITMVEDDLARRQRGVGQRIQELEVMYRSTGVHFEELNVYIAAAQIEMRLLEGELTTLEAKASQSGNMEDSEAVAAHKFRMNVLGQQIDGLIDSAMASLMARGQIRLLGEGDVAVSQMLSSAIRFTIPIWRLQAAVLLELNEQKQDTQALQSLREKNAELLTQGATAVRQQSAEVRKLASQSTVSVETWVKVQDEVLAAFEEAQTIDDAAIEARRTRQARIEELYDKQQQFHLGKGKILEQRSIQAA